MGHPLRSGVMGDSPIQGRPDGRAGGTRVSVVPEARRSVAQVRLVNHVVQLVSQVRPSSTENA